MAQKRPKLFAGIIQPNQCRSIYATTKHFQICV